MAPWAQLPTLHFCDTHSWLIKQAAPSAIFPLKASLHDCGVLLGWSLRLQPSDANAFRQSDAAAASYWIVPALTSAVIWLRLAAVAPAQVV